jgi:hypothetical protein
VQNAASQVAQGLQDVSDALQKICKPDCWRIEAELTKWAIEVRWRYYAALIDQKKLYDRARQIPLSRRGGSWLGHKKQFEDAQKKLRDVIAEADANNCLVTDEDRKLSVAPFPVRPGGRFD